MFEWRGCLGGVWTAGLLGYLLDFDKPGFNQELLKRLEAREMRRGTVKGSVVYEPEGMKLLLEEMFVEAGVKFQLHTRVSAAYREGQRLTTIVTESKSGRQAWRAPFSSTPPAMATSVRWRDAALSMASPIRARASRCR